MFEVMSSEKLGYQLCVKQLLAFIIERLVNLKPGINTTLKHYEELRSQKEALTIRLIDSILKSKGYDFDERHGSLYITANSILRIEPFDGQVFRA
jgi:hypothetical protein